MLAWYRKNAEEDPELSDTAQIVFGIRRSELQSEILEALILSKCPADIIEKSFAIPAEAVAWYAELFFDLSTFRTTLDTIEYVETYKTAWARDLKLRAVNLGYEYVLFTYANLVPETEQQKKLVERMFMATAYKAMAINYNGIGSTATSQAIKHAELMLKAHNALVKTNDSDINESRMLIHALTGDIELPSSDLIPNQEDIV